MVEESGWVGEPVSVLCSIVRSLCPPGGVVLDPFMGSESTGLAARMEGRKWRGIEIGEENHSLIEAKTMMGVASMDNEW